MVQQVRLVLKQFRGLVLHCGLKRLRVGTGDPVPGLGLTPTTQTAMEKKYWMISKDKRSDISLADPIDHIDVDESAIWRGKCIATGKLHEF